MFARGEAPGFGEQYFPAPKVRYKKYVLFTTFDYFAPLGLNVLDEEIPSLRNGLIDFAPLVLISKDIYHTWYKKVGLLDKSCSRLGFDSDWIDSYIEI